MNNLSITVINNARSIATGIKITKEAQDDTVDNLSAFAVLKRCPPIIDYSQIDNKIQNQLLKKNLRTGGKAHIQIKNRKEDDNTARVAKWLKKGANRTNKIGLTASNLSFLQQAENVALINNTCRVDGLNALHVTIGNYGSGKMVVDLVKALTINIKKCSQLTSSSLTVFNPSSTGEQIGRLMGALSRTPNLKKVVLATLPQFIEGNAMKAAFVEGMKKMTANLRLNSLIVSINVRSERQAYESGEAINVLTYFIKKTTHVACLTLNLDVSSFKKALVPSFDEEANFSTNSGLVIVDGGFVEKLFQLIQQSGILSSLEKLAINFVNGYFSSEVIQQIRNKIAELHITNLSIEQ